MKITYAIIIIFLLSACGDDAPKESKEKENQVVEKVEEIEDLEGIISSVTEEETGYTYPEPIIYEVDPMEYPLQGTIDGDSIYMQLDFHAHKIEGKYMYKKYKKPIALEGYYTITGFILNEFTKEGAVSAYFLAEGNYRNFSGKWHKTDALHNGSVKLSLADSYGVYLEPTDQFTALGQDGPSEFAIEKGLARNCDDCISFRSIAKSNQYLRHQSFQIKQHGYKDCKDNLYRSDASFKMLPGLTSDTTVSFQSFNYPNHYMFYNTSSNRFAMMKKSEMTLEQKVKASFVLEKQQVDAGGLDFSLAPQKLKGMEETPFLTGRIKKEAYKLIDAAVGDGAIYFFEDQNGNEIYFMKNLDENFDLVVEVPEGEANTDNQGWMVNPQYVGVWFEVNYSEMFTYTDFNMAEYADILAIRSLKKL